MIKHYISNRYNGVSLPPYHELNVAFHVGDDPERVTTNRQLLYTQAGIKEAIFMEQIHSTTIAYVDRLCTPRCDGIITDRPNLPLAVMSADCYAVLLYDKERGAIGALHAGRKGAMGGIVPKAIEMMRQLLNAHQIETIISPGIGVCCYEVGEEILAKADPRYIEDNRLDIKGMIIDQLREYGVDFYDYGICTACNSDYYSYRRDGVTGRFASIIWRER